MEYAMDKTMIDDITTKKTNSDSATTYKLTNVSGMHKWLLPPATVTSTYFSAVDVTATDGVAKNYGGSSAAATKYADDVKAIDKWNKSKAAYLTSMATYTKDAKTYIGTYTDVLIEIWDDFIGKAREADELTAALKNVGTEPTVPTKPTTKLANPLLTDFDCAGKPCKLSGSTATGYRGFGTVGAVSSSSVVPIDYPKTEVDYYTVAGWTNTKAWGLAKDTCRPKVMHVTANIKKDGFTAPAGTGTHKATFTFRVADIKNLSELVVTPLDATVSKATIGLNGDTGIADLDKYYEANGSSNLMATGLAAAMIALTLY